MIGIVGLVLAIIILIVIVVKRYRIADPDQAIIVTGRGKSTEDLSGQKVVTGGAVFVLPFVQKAFDLSLRSRRLSIKTTAQDVNGVTISAQAVAVVKVGGSDEMIRAAAQRFLSQQEEIETSTTEVLSGSLRGIIGGITVEDLIRDRQKLASAVLAAAEEALTKQGLIVDTLQIQEISDTLNYVSNLGRPEAARVLQKAEIADVEANRNAENAKIEAQQSLLERRRDLKLREAAILEETDRASAVAAAAKPREDAIQRQKIVEAEEVTAQKEAALREQQLNATVRKEADAEAYRVRTLASAQAEAAASTAEGQKRADVAAGEAERAARIAKAEALKAEGLAEAEAIAAKGKAEADSIAARADALAAQSQAVLAQDVIKALPEIAAKFADGYAGIDQLTIVSADGANRINNDIVGGMKGLTEMVKDSVGVDLPGIMNGVVTGSATGTAIGRSLDGGAEGKA